MKPNTFILLRYGILLFSTMFTFKVFAQSNVSLNNNVLHETTQRPNVIVVLTDDLGWGSISYHNNPIVKTQNIDRFAAKSLELTDFHVEPMCSPTRGELMTGIDAVRNGVVNVSSGRAILRRGIPTVANFFSKVGYRSAIFGKWHLGYNYPFRPIDRGFDEAVWFPSSHINSVPDYWGNDYFDDVYFHNGKKEQYKGYCTDVFFGEAIKWMKKQADEGKPFFVYLPTNAAHMPLYAPQKDIQAIKKTVTKKHLLTKVSTPLKNKYIHYLAMIRNIDMNFGRLLSFLSKNGLTKNTIVIFTNDNGGTFEDLDKNEGMRGKKAQLWEGGHRVFFFMRWPNGNFGRPRKIDGLTTVQDVLPTLLNLADVTPFKPTRFDGINLSSVLRGKTSVPEERMVVINYSRMPIGFDYPSPMAQSFIRRNGSEVLWKKWRLLNFDKLYNLKSDPMERHNVIDKYPKVAKKMRAHLQTWWEGVKEVANKVPPVEIGSRSENPTLLTSVQWQNVFVDQQKQVRAGVRKNSYWNIKVAQPGTYKFELRRWPKEADLALDSPLPSDQVRPDDSFFDSGIALPIADARIYIRKAADSISNREPTLLRKKKKVHRGDKGITFTTHLNAGLIRLATWFDDEKGEPICGAYYVYVTRE